MTCDKILFTQMQACEALLKCTRVGSLNRIDPAMSLGASNYIIAVLENFTHVLSKEAG